MSKLFAWPMDVKLFLVDIAEMTNEEAGIYIRMLCYQWENDSITSDLNRFPFRLPISNPSNNTGWGSEIPPMVLENFKMDAKGKLRNERMVETKKEVIEKLDKQINGGRKGAENRWGKGGDNDELPNEVPNSSPHGLPMAVKVKVIYITDTIVSVPPTDFSDYKAWGFIKENTPEECSLYFKLAIEFYKLIKANLTALNINAPHLNHARVDNWIRPIRLLIQTDKFKVEDIREAYTFLKKDKFWKQQIQSTENLRNHMVQILVKARSNGQQSNTNGTDVSSFLDNKRARQKNRSQGNA